MTKPPWTSLLMLATAVLASFPAAADLEALWRAHRVEAYRPPPPEELARAEALFLRTLAGPAAPGLAADWAALGFDLRPLDDDARRLWVLAEQPRRRDGRGLFALAGDPAGRLYLQAPHSFKDLHTGRIGLRLFAEGAFAAGAWNTVPRRYTDEDEDPVQADMAHHEASYLEPFTRALVRHQPQALTLQLHGFAGGSRRSAAARGAGFIVSAGSTRASVAAEALTRCLADRFGAPALLYPRDTRELGGTRNRIGRILRAAGNEGFLHLEAALAIRQRLRDDAGSRRRLLTCLDEVD